MNCLGQKEHFLKAVLVIQHNIPCKTIRELKLSTSKKQFQDHRKTVKNYKQITILQLEKQGLKIQMITLGHIK